MQLLPGGDPEWLGFCEHWLLVPGGAPPLDRTCMITGSRSHKPAPSPWSNLASTTTLQHCINTTAAINSTALAILAVDAISFGASVGGAGVRVTYCYRLIDQQASAIECV